MSKAPKPSGLAAFTSKRPAAAPAEPAAAPAPAPGKRARGKADQVALTVRVTRADWVRLHHLALAEGISLQTLAVRGFNAELARHGLPELES